jgi:hypothetical protein
VLADPARKLESLVLFGSHVLPSFLSASTLASASDDARSDLLYPWSTVSVEGSTRLLVSRPGTES